MFNKIKVPKWFFGCVVQGKTFKWYRAFTVTELLHYVKVLNILKGSLSNHIQQVVHKIVEPFNHATTHFMHSRGSLSCHHSIFVFTLYS